MPIKNILFSDRDTCERAICIEIASGSPHSNLETAVVGLD